MWTVLIVYCWTIHVKIVSLGQNIHSSFPMMAGSLHCAYWRMLKTSCSKRLEINLGFTVSGMVHLGLQIIGLPKIFSAITFSESLILPNSFKGRRIDIKSMVIEEEESTRKGKIWPSLLRCAVFRPEFTFWVILFCGISHFAWLYSRETDFYSMGSWRR